MIPERLAKVLWFFSKLACWIMGHAWICAGARPCPYGSQTCSQPVFYCWLCGDWDYGEKVGPADDVCSKCTEDLGNAISDP